MEQPQPYIPVKKARRGRTPTVYVCDAKVLSLKVRMQQIPAEQWQTITHRCGTKGPLTRKAAILNAYLWKPEDLTAFESVQLLISTEVDGAEIKYSLCYTPDGKQSLETALFHAFGAKEPIRMLKNNSVCINTKSVRGGLGITTLP